MKAEFNEEENNSENEGEGPDLYNINIFRIKANENAPMCKLLSKLENKNDFKCEVIIDNKLDTVIADTGAHVSVCGTNQAKRWNLLDRIHLKSRLSHITVRSYQFMVYQNVLYLSEVHQYQLNGTLFSVLVNQYYLVTRLYNWESLISMQSHPHFNQSS